MSNQYLENLVVVELVYADWLGVDAGTLLKRNGTDRWVLVLEHPSVRFQSQGVYNICWAELHVWALEDNEKFNFSGPTAENAKTAIIGLKDHITAFYSVWNLPTLP